jgi:hypothetical protein
MPSRSSIRRSADDVRAAVKTIIDSADPEGRLKMGARGDEYGQEIVMITARLRSLRIPTVSAIETLLLDVWREQYGPLDEDQESTYRNAFRPVAESLLAAVARG